MTKYTLAGRCLSRFLFSSVLVLFFGRVLLVQLHEGLVRTAELAAADVETVIVADGRLAHVVLTHHAPAAEGTGAPDYVLDWSVVGVFYLCYVTAAVSALAISSTSVLIDAYAFPHR